ncbi:hypothetical protein BJ170DRAFT_677572 [Xylariales sp. AK1849]|nr:hypothetical protein BJ170DRAFT_677572 [Xylariales sp. AK1849]
MSSDYSDDDMPLARPNGHLSAATVSKADDRAMGNGVTAAQGLPAPVSVRNGPITGTDAMDIDSPQVNGNTKRKSRSSLNQVSYKDESDSDAPIAKRQRKVESDSDDDAPLKNRKVRLPPKATKADILDSDSDDDKPLTLQLAQKKKSIENAAVKETKVKKPTPKKPVKDDSDSDAPLAAPKGKRQTNGVAKSNGIKREADSDSDAPLQRKPKPKPKAAAAPKGKAKADKETPARKAAGKKAAKKEVSEAPDEAEEEEYKWWTAPKQEDDSIKWNTLEHSGVKFADPYEPLPKSVKLIYDGTPVTLDPEAEEVAGFFGAMLNSEHNVGNPVFQKNFFGDFKEILTRTGGAKDRQGNKVNIKEFDKLDFKPIFNYYQAKSQAKKDRSKEEKKAEKEAKTAEEAPFTHCLWNGRKQKVGNFRVEPPALFRGRGEHPKTGKLKFRVLPEQITINIGKGAKVPQPPPGHKWKHVQHDQKATWLAMWQENINGNYKYVMLSHDSDVKGQSDYKKFEKARALKDHIARIRKDYNVEMKSDVMADRQRATAMYLIDKLALRAGNEKDTDNEAETVGCCSLKYQHITLQDPDVVIFDFLGKDSIRYYDEVKVERQVFKNLKLFKKPPKAEGDDVFDRLNTSQLNKHLSSYMPGLTAKVFRTYNASWTMSKLLEEIKLPKNATLADKLAAYNKANREVAILCNHKRTVTATHEASMGKKEDRIKAVQFQLWRTKLMLLDIDPKQKKKRGAEFFALDKELNNETWVQEHITFLVEEQRSKITKKFENDNKKRVANGEKAFPEKDLKELLKVADDLGKQRKKEWKSKKVEAEGKGPTVDKIDDKIQKLETQLNKLKNEKTTANENKENYIDPRLSVVFSKKFDIPMAKLFNGTLMSKFQWAIESTEADWQF